MTLSLFHTAQSHVARFDRVAVRIAPGVALRHEVRADWLARAQGGIDAALRDEICNEIAQIEGPVLCSCTTIGPVAEAAGALRVDWPMMQMAAQAGGPILMVYCLDSTYEPSLALLERALSEMGCPQRVYPLPLTQFWPLFEADEVQAFDVVIAAEIREALRVQRDVAAVVLAQASMEGVAARLGDVEARVLGSPEIALRAALGLLLDS